jgi:hypothetical protein
MEEANKLPIGDPIYDQMKEKADKLLEKAIPTLEKAETINPNDVSTLISLKQLYTRTNNMEKLKVIDEKIKNLK